MSSTLEANMRATTEALLHAWDGQWQPDATLNLRAPECEHSMLPSTLNIPKRNNTQFEEDIKKIAPLVSEGQMTMVDYVSNAAERRVVCLSSLKAKTPVGPYANEYVWFLTFDETGTKIVKIVEMLDGIAAKSLLDGLVDAGLREKR